MQEIIGLKVQKLAGIFRIIGILAICASGIYIFIKNLPGGMIYGAIFGRDAGFIVLLILLVAAYIALGIFFVHFLYVLMVAFGDMVENTRLIKTKLNADEVSDQTASAGISNTVGNIGNASGSKGVVVPIGNIIRQSVKDKKKNADNSIINDISTKERSTNPAEEISNTTASQETAVCKNCGEAIDPGSKFCFICGTPIGK